jgi:hypothetical protein
MRGQRRADEQGITDETSRRCCQGWCAARSVVTLVGILGSILSAPTIEAASPQPTVSLPSVASTAVSHLRDISMQYTPTATVSASPSPTPTPATATPSPSPTITPSPSLTASPTPTPSPTPQLSKPTLQPSTPSLVSSATPTPTSASPLRQHHPVHSASRWRVQMLRMHYRQRHQHRLQQQKRLHIHRLHIVSHRHASTPAVPTIAWPTIAELRAAGRLPHSDRIPWAVRRWAYLILPTAHRTKIPATMIAAVMTVESGGDPLAWNPRSDARGLMQVLHGPWDPAKNIAIGASMLAAFRQEFGNWRLALAAYNAGPNAVLAAGGVPPFAETRDYVVIVRYLYDLYSHYPLSVARLAQYHRVLRDYQRRAPHLRHIASPQWLSTHTPPLSFILENVGQLTNGLVCALQLCTSQNAGFAVVLHDPLWPLGGPPDPLPLVVPPH